MDYDTRLLSSSFVRSTLAATVNNGLRSRYGQFDAKKRRDAIFNLRTLDLNLLTVFEAIYEVRSVSGAAERLALSQSATSHALARLRAACGDDLFIRNRYGLFPTSVAKTIYPAIKQALEALRASLAAASDFDPTSAQGRFLISIPHPLGPFYALAIKTTVAGIAPGIVLNFETVSRPVDLEKSLRDGLVDLAVDWLPIELDPFVNTKIFDDHLALAARGGHPTANEGLTIEDLRREQFVGSHRRREIADLPQAIRAFLSLEMPEAVRVSELLEVPTVVSSTDLLGIIPMSMRSLLEKRLGLRILPIPIELPSVPIYMVWHVERRNDAAHRWLREIVLTEVKRFSHKEMVGA